MTSTTNWVSGSDRVMQLTAGYQMSFDQLASLLKFSIEDSRPRLLRTEIADALGVANLHAEKLCTMAQYLGLITKLNQKPTPLGRLMFSQDPYLDDLGTLWFLHYVIGSDYRVLFWNRVVNDLVPTRKKLTREQMRVEFNDLQGKFTEYTAKSHVLKELNVVLDAYTVQNFSRLAYLRQDGEAFSLGYREPVPPLVLAASIACYRDRYLPGSNSIPVYDLRTERNSPGVVFQLEDSKLRTLLEQLKVQSGFSLESRADLDQIRLTDGTPDYEWMERYYASR